MHIGYRFYSIDKDTLQVKSLYPALCCDEIKFEFKVPRMVDSNLMLYLSSDYCLKVFYNGYEHTIEVSRQGVSYYLYINNKCCASVLETYKDFCACKIAGSVLICFYEWTILLFEDKAYYLSIFGTRLLTVVKGLEKFDDSSKLEGYCIGDTIVGAKADQNRFKRKMVLESI